jgi:hypothetical protein
MATKKKAKKKTTKSRKTSRKKTAPAKNKKKNKSARKATPAKSAKKLAKKARKKSPAASVRAKAAVATAKTTPSPKPVRERREGADEALPGTRRAPAQSEDLRGASRAEQSDSESVDELLDEGNTFEAGVVSGVEKADNADESEVHTREFPEDDVPEEYLDKD